MFRTRRTAQLEKRDSPGGFTLVELIVSMVIISFILGTAWIVYIAGFKAFSGQAIRAGVVVETQGTLFEIGSALRQANSITTAGQASLIFTADINSDGINETIQYSWGGVSGNPFNKTTTSTVPMVHSVSNLAFSYYDVNENLLSFPVAASQVGRVTVDITAASGSESFTTRVSAELRCL